MKHVLVILVCTWFASCEKNDSETESTDETAGVETPNTTEDPDSSQTGTLVVDANASAVILVTSNALASASEGESFGTLSPTNTSPGNLSIVSGDSETEASLTNLEEDGPSAANPNCSGNGGPFDADGQELELGDPGFIQKSFYCLLHDKESPDVVLGALGIIRGFICMAERMDGFGYSAEGTRVDFAFDDVLSHESAIACFPPEVIENSKDDSGEKKEYVGSATGYLLSEGPWTHRIKLVGQASDEEEEDNEPEDTFFLVSSDKAAFKRGGISASLDFKTGILRFENLESEQGRHTRLLVKGDMESDGSFTSLAEIQGLQTQGFHKVLSAKGSSKGTFTYNSYVYNCGDCTEVSSQEGQAGTIIETTGGEWQHRGSECFPKTSDCSASNGIVFETEEDAKFPATSHEDLFESVISPWLVSHAPLCFEEVETALVPNGDCEF